MLVTPNRAASFYSLSLERILKSHFDGASLKDHMRLLQGDYSSLIGLLFQYATGAEYVSVLAHQG